MLARGRPIIPGDAHGCVLLAKRPLSFWGGIHPETGLIIDHRHDRYGESVVGRIFAFPAEKGSSTGSAVLLELARIGKGPAAILTREMAPILALGSIIAEELYNVAVPIFLVTDRQFEALSDGESVHISKDGTVRSVDDAL